MKRLFCAFLALAMTLSCVLVLASCGSDDQKQEPAATPDGYATYNNGDISFAYPSAWTVKDGNPATIADEAGAKNNITVVYEPKNDTYEKSSDAELEKTFKDSLSMMGMSISEFKRTKTKNDYNDIIKISFVSAVSGISIRQTQFIANVGERTYVVTVTEMATDKTLVDNVFNTFVVLK